MDELIYILNYSLKIPCQAEFVKAVPGAHLMIMINMIMLILTTMLMLTILITKLMMIMVQMMTGNLGQPGHLQLHQIQLKLGAQALQADQQ